MTKLKFAALLTVCGFLVALFTSPLRAAPDNTNGMALMGAFVSSGGSLVKASGATGVVFVDTGQYQVVFDRNVSECFYSVTTVNNNVTASAVQEAPQVVQVLISEGPPTSSAFYLIVFCPR